MKSLLQLLMWLLLELNADKTEKGDCVDKLLSGWQESYLAARVLLHSSCHWLFNVAGCMWLWEILTFSTSVTLKQNSRLDYWFHEKLFWLKKISSPFTNVHCTVYWYWGRFYSFNLSQCMFYIDLFNSVV